MTLPRERFGSDVEEGPTDRAPSAGAELHDVLALSTSHELDPQLRDGVSPHSAPRLERWVEDAQCASVPVEGRLEGGASIAASRCDPNVLYRAAFEHPAKMRLDAGARQRP